MPQHVSLRPGDPSWVGRYRLGGRLQGIPTDDPIFIGFAPDGTEVAISMLQGDWAHDAAARDRFAAEAAVARRVPPFCTARVLDAGVDPAGPYLVSDYVAGPSLLELVQTRGVLHGHDLEAVAVGMATGLASVHQAGLVHGSFGPEYVIMGADGAPRVVEFGITPPYGTATPAADMLAWAQTVAFAASGHPAETPQDLDVLPARLRGPVAECLEPDPENRPAARAVVRSLLGDTDLRAGLLAAGSRHAVRQDPRAQSGRTREPAAAAPGPQARASARPAGLHQRTRFSPGRRRALLIAAIVVVLVAAAGIVHAVTSGGSNPGSDRLSASSRDEKRPTPSATPSPGSSARTPAAFAGSWAGLVRQPPTDTYDVTVTLATGATSGTVSYSGTNFSCSGTLTLTAATASELSLSQGIVHGQSDCENGRVTIKLTSAGSVWFSFHSDGPTAAGRLQHR